MRLQSLGDKKGTWLSGGFRSIKVSQDPLETRPKESRKRKTEGDSSSSGEDVEIIEQKEKKKCLRRQLLPNGNDVASSSSGELNYKKHWPKRYRELSDVDLIVEGYSFPAHAAVLSQSKILCAALHDEDNLRISRRISLTQIFRGVSIAQFDLLLSHVYSTHARLIPSKPDVSCQLAVLAQRFGFNGVLEKVIDSVMDVEQNAFQRHLRAALNSMDPGVVENWLRISGQTGHPELGQQMGSFLAEKFDQIFDSRDGKWNAVRGIVEGDASVWKNVSFCLFRNSRKSGAPLGVKGSPTG
ncbi:hypothetical protein BSKO_12447 [Bryopsis sp. KO-2023]|nr:hypothetical protein BSKO_12447 [Bryopsis sp. KO-2023]